MSSILLNIYSNLNDIFDNIKLKEYIEDDFDPDVDFKINPNIKNIISKKTKETAELFNNSDTEKTRIENILKSYVPTNIPNFLLLLSTFFNEVDKSISIGMLIPLILPSSLNYLVINILIELNWFTLSNEERFNYLIPFIENHKNIARNTVIKLLNILAKDPKPEYSKFKEYIISILPLLNVETRTTFNKQLLFLSENPSFAITISKSKVSISFKNYIDNIKKLFLNIKTFLKNDNDDVNETDILKIINEVFRKYNFNNKPVSEQESFIISIIEYSTKLPIRNNIINNIIKTNSEFTTQYTPKVINISNKKGFKMTKDNEYDYE